MIAIRALSRSFGGKTVFETPRELASRRAGLIALTGANGSGKTTLLRVLATLTAPSAGDAWIDSRSVRQDPRGARASLGFVPAGEGGMFAQLTGRENLQIFAALMGLSRGETAQALERTREALPGDGFAHALDTRYAAASSGMKRALLLARALMRDPRVLLLDEPTRALDPEARAALWSAITCLGEGRVVLYSTHLQDEWRLADRVWVIQKGRLLEEAAMPARGLAEATC